ncbi:MAG: FHA domain-containing protein [Anaerolineae bacterium]|nr:FHA domain-containing protein [Anaerolineae bacterium]
MTAIDELFSEYVRMRQHGLDANEALRALRHYIEPLAQEEREELARHLRGWENNLIAPGMKLPDNLPDTSPLPEESTHGEIWLQCPNCGRKNRARDVFCYSCGRLLGELGYQDTRTFRSATEELYNDEYFGEDSLLILTCPKDKTRFEIRPQLQRTDIVLGRSSEEQTVSPNIDLAPLQAAELGVSRLHLSISYDETLELIQIHDLGSANGTMVNGQKIHPSERRILRQRDELALGRLVLNVHYQHPGEEIAMN